MHDTTKRCTSLKVGEWAGKVVKVVSGDFDGEVLCARNIIEQQRDLIEEDEGRETLL